MNEGWIEEHEALPKAGSHRLIDFERAELVEEAMHLYMGAPPHFHLQVSGRKPYANMWVDLAPLAYVGRPEYQGIEVVGRLPLGIGLRSEEAQYDLSIPLYGITGTEGVEVIGATRSERIAVPHEQSAGERSDWYASHDHRPPGPATLTVTGKCKFPTPIIKWFLSRREPQGINPKDLLLDLVVAGGIEGSEEKETTLEVRYEEQTDFEYETVTVLPAGVTVPVVDAH